MQLSHQRVAKSLVRFVAIMSIALLSLLGTAALRHSPGTAVLSATSPSNLLEAAVPNRVQVPPSMRSAPFDIQRTLNLPPNFQIAVYARIPGARFMVIAPNGDLLVSQPGDGKVVIVRPNLSGDPLISDFVTGLRKPQDIVFHTVGTTTYVYISESHQINRFIYNSGDLTAHDRQIVVANLPDSSSPELHGVYGHELKNMILDANDKLYVSIASTCNACIEDTVSDPIRGAIYQYNADGSSGRLFARGLRNAEGLAMLPGTNDLWVAVNNRDNLAYPLQDTTGSYGQVVQSYVDNHPPEEFTQVRDGGNYGWPFANPNPDTASGYDNMPFDLDVQFNADGHVALSNLDRINKGIQAHSAPLGLTFLQNSAFPSAYRAGAVVGLHGSWNRSQKTGYKVIYFPWNSTTQTPDRQADLVTGWLNDTDQTFWGRPVDVVVDLQGNLLISDDASGTVYKLIYGGSNQQLLQAVSAAYHLDGPSLTGVADELVFSMGNTIFAVKTNGDVWAQDVVGHQVGNAYKLNSINYKSAAAK